MKKFIVVLFSCLLLYPAVSMADAVDRLLAKPEVPKGVVFELVTAEESNWQVALPFIQNAIKKIRGKYPQLPVAIVSHGLEQFALLQKNQQTQVKTHKGIQSLMKDNVTIEVCGTFSEWNGYDNKDFPEYVSIVDQGPVAVDIYRQQGYAVIIFTEAMMRAMKKSL